MTTETGKKSKREVEIKIKIDSIEKTKENILAQGYRVIVPSSFESNTVYDTPDLQFKKKGRLLRLRKSNGRTILTYKYPPAQPVESKDYKIKEEIEVDVSDFDRMQTIIQSMGYDIFFIYEKRREILKSNDGRVTVTIDLTQVGDYMEIEADEEEIDRLAESLGYSKKDYITATYYDLYLKKAAPGK